MFNRSRRLRGLVVLVAASSLALAGCTGTSGGEGTDNNNDSTAAGFGACASKPNECNGGDAKAGGQITYFEDQDIATWNTAGADGGHYPTVVMLNGLIPGVYYAAPDLTPALNTDLMAEEPKVTSESPQTVVYKIKPEAVWNDGTPISADDFIYQFKTRNKRDCPKCASASNTGYDTMASVVGSDGGKTVTVTWQNGVKYPDWKSAFDALYPAQVAKASGGVDTADQLAASWEALGKTQPKWSGGPYQIDTYTEGQQLILVPNTKWYGKTKPALEKVIFKIVTDQSSLVPALQNNEVQAGDPIPNADMVNQVKQLPDFHSLVSAGLSWEHVDINLQNKFLADKALREAIFRSIDVNGIIARTVGPFFPEAKPLYNHNYMPASKYFKDVVSGTGAGKGDLEAAKKALTDAGYTGVGTDLKTKAGEDVPALRMRHTAGNTNRAATAELVQRSLKGLGIDVTIQPTEKLSDTLDKGDFDLIVFAWVNSPFTLSGADQIWGATSDSNFGKWNNPEADKLLKDAVQQLDQQKGADLLNQANELMAKDYYVLPLFQRPNFIVTKKDYVNIRPNTTSTGPTYNISEWGLRASAN